MDVTNNLKTVYTYNYVDPNTGETKSKELKQAPPTDKTRVIILDISERGREQSEKLSKFLNSQKTLNNQQLKSEEYEVDIESLRNKSQDEPIPFRRLTDDEANERMFERLIKNYKEMKDAFAVEIFSSLKNNMKYEDAVDYYSKLRNSLTATTKEYGETPEERAITREKALKEVEELSESMYADSNNKDKFLEIAKQLKNEAELVEKGYYYYLDTDTGGWTLKRDSWKDFRAKYYQEDNVLNDLYEKHVSKDLYEKYKNNTLSEKDWSAFYKELFTYKQGEKHFSEEYTEYYQYLDKRIDDAINNAQNL